MPSDVIRPIAFDPGSQLAREALPATSAPVTVAQQPARPPAASLAPPRGISIRTVPRTAIEALVTRLVASGAVTAPATEARL